MPASNLHAYHTAVSGPCQGPIPRLIREELAVYAGRSRHTRRIQGPENGQQAQGDLAPATRIYSRRSRGGTAAGGSSSPRPEAVAGDLTPTLIREWGPLLKPAGIGLLVALHSFEETTPGHTYYGWAHCTQNALAAYLDTSQDTIARYTNLLQTTGLLQVEEVETPRGKQKLYRTARGLLLPSLALLEYLVFDADTWTRKHAAWLTQRLAPLGADTELTRLAAIMRRAYQVSIDSRGLGNVPAAARLTRPNSYIRRREPTAHQPGLLPPDASASCGQGAPLPDCPNRTSHIRIMRTTRRTGPAAGPQWSRIQRTSSDRYIHARDGLRIMRASRYDI